MNDRVGADSRCSQSENAPYLWVSDFDPKNDRVQELDNWIKGLAPFNREHYLGELEALFEDAAAGELKDVGDARTPIKPVRMDPDLYELRHQVLKRKLRFYHGEPPKYPELLVRLHKHIKRTHDDGNLSGADAKADQDKQMEFAIERYRGLERKQL